jgi:hypothetical protein
MAQPQLQLCPQPSVEITGEQQQVSRTITTRLVASVDAADATSMTGIV